MSNDYATYEKQQSQYSNMKEKCYYHEYADAITICSNCGQLICGICLANPVHNICVNCIGAEKQIRLLHKKQNRAIVFLVLLLVYVVTVTVLAILDKEVVVTSLYFLFPCIAMVSILTGVFVAIDVLFSNSTAKAGCGLALLYPIVMAVSSVFGAVLFIPYLIYKLVVVFTVGKTIRKKISQLQ